MFHKLIIFSENLIPKISNPDIDHSVLKHLTLTIFSSVYHLAKPMQNSCSNYGKSTIIMLGYRVKSRLKKSLFF